MFGKKTLSAVFVCVGMAAGAHSAHAEVQLTMSAGRVSLSAKNATVLQILAEWAKVGQTKIVNPERVGGGPMTLELTNVPELEAIDILLRSAGGYVLAPRAAGTPNASRYDRILILPPSTSVSSAPRAASAPTPLQQRRAFAPPQPGQFSVQQPSNDDAGDSPERPASVNPAVQNPRPPVFNTFPQAAPQRTEPPAPPAPASSFSAPVGVAVPGMVAPTPQPAGGQPGVVSPQQQQR